MGIFSKRAEACGSVQQNPVRDLWYEINVGNTSRCVACTCREGSMYVCWKSHIHEDSRTRFK
jgi:hypothetical protein